MALPQCGKAVKGREKSWTRLDSTTYSTNTFTFTAIVISYLSFCFTPITYHLHYITVLHSTLQATATTVRQRNLFCVTRLSSCGPLVKLPTTQALTESFLSSSHSGWVETRDAGAIIGKGRDFFTVCGSGKATECRACSCQSLAGDRESSESRMETSHLADDRDETRPGFWMSKTVVDQMGS